MPTFTQRPSTGRLTRRALTALTLVALLLGVTAMTADAKAPPPPPKGDLRLYQVSDPEGYHDTMPLDAANAASFSSNFFKLEASAGRVYSLNFGSAHPELGLVRLYRCVNDGAPRPRVFAFYLSRDVNCEGVTRGENSSISTRGDDWAWVWPTQKPGTHPIYRCHRPEAWDWIATARKDCEGRPGYVNQLILGYAY